MEIEIVEKDNLYGLKVDGKMVIECQYYNIHPIPHTPYLIVVKNSGIAKNGSFIRAMNAIDLTSDKIGFIFEEDFYYYTLEESVLKPKGLSRLVHKKVNKKYNPNGYQY